MLLLRQGQKDRSRSTLWQRPAVQMMGPKSVLTDTRSHGSRRRHHHDHTLPNGEESSEENDAGEEGDEHDEGKGNFLLCRRIAITTRVFSNSGVTVIRDYADSPLEQRGRRGYAE